MKDVRRVQVFKPEIHDQTLMPALQSAWFIPHVTVYMFSYSLCGCAFLISIVGVAVLMILLRKGVFEIWRPFGMNIVFSSGAFTLGGFGIIGGLAALDFDKAFTVFHTLFFPGKSNWYFSWYEDQIIRILPQDFFMNCAILIFASIVLLCIDVAETLRDVVIEDVRVVLLHDSLDGR